jgi:hypothetical protein
MPAIQPNRVETPFWLTNQEQIMRTVNVPTAVHPLS